MSPSNRMKILAPAGDEAMLRAAVFSGADCVYLGLKGFNARRTAANFEGEALRQAVAFCHARGCGVYAAVNTLVLPGREAEMRRTVADAAEAGCDAIILQDLAVAKAAREIAPHMALHASTQMSVHSLAGVETLAELGFARAILARELAEDEIAAIAEKSPIELEVFIHGALCQSVSGQCYASAFLGGRSANRGGCAGPCRLPFRVVGAGEAGGREEAFYAAVARGGAAGENGKNADVAGQRKTPKAGEDSHHLSLKDLSILDALPRLQAMGIAAAKIEGRLRGPEYCAVAVDCARRARDGQPYDKQLLQDVFSRSGFTDGWFTGKNGGEMFGARTESDTAAAKRAAPKARELYRRECPRVPVEMALRFGQKGGYLEITDGRHTVRRPFEGPLPAAERDPAPALRQALAKTGGTPFYLKKEAAVETRGAFLPAQQANTLRRQLLEELLELRGKSPVRAAPLPAQKTAPTPIAVQPPAPMLDGGLAVGTAGGAAGREMHAAAAAAKKAGGIPLLRGRFASVGQLPPGAGDMCAWLVLPLAQAERVPGTLRKKTFLALPRVLFGPAEEKTAQQVAAAAQMGFAGFEVNNLAHYRLCRGQVVSGGFGLNVANAGSLSAAAAMGCAAVTLSPELSLAQMRDVAGAGGAAEAVATDAVCYGHMPLMLTRACPVKISRKGCAGCPKRALLADRQGKPFPLVCDGDTRTLLNPVPLWMADRLAQLPIDTATLYFTIEPQRQAGEILAAFAEGRPAQGPFTRGLYDKGTEG